jgi:phage replication-related protein YjqB (UPF0714/DUF867 family)
VAFAELLAHPDVLEESALRSPVGFLALHGGLEPGTAEIARTAAAAAGASLYAVVQPADLRCHVPSHETDPAGAPGLASFLEHVQVVISVHGYFSRRHELDHAILVGGAERALAVALATRLREAIPHVSVVDDPALIPADLRGLHARNPVNRAAGGGVQLELPPLVRVVGRTADRPEVAPYRAQTVVLVETLAAFARGLA